MGSLLSSAGYVINLITFIINSTKLLINIENKLKIIVTDRTWRAKTHVANSGQSFSCCGGSRVHILLGRWTRTLPPPCDMNFQKMNTHTAAELMPSHILYCRPFSAEVCFVVLMFP